MVEHGGSISASFRNYEMVNLGKWLDFWPDTENLEIDVNFIGELVKGEI